MKINSYTDKYKDFLTKEQKKGREKPHMCSIGLGLICF